MAQSTEEQVGRLMEEAHQWHVAHKVASVLKWFTIIMALIVWDARFLLVWFIPFALYWLARVREHRLLSRIEKMAKEALG
jgi:hypothetical protein